MTWIGIVNETAGATAQKVDSLVQQAAASGADVRFETTVSLEHMADVVNAAASSGTRRFLAVGGDGTVHHLANVLMAHATEADRFSIALLPAGSGSDLARTFALSTAPEDAFARLVHPDLYPVDIGLVEVGDTRRWFLNACNVGVAAGAVRVSQSFPRRSGKLKYVAAFWLHLARAPIADMTVKVDRHRFEGNAINVVVANGQFFGGGMNIAPRASMQDGDFDVQVFSGPKRRAFSVMPRVIKGSHLTHPAVRRYVGSSVTVSADRPLPVEADGELVGSGDVSISMIPSAIDLVV